MSLSKVIRFLSISLFIFLAACSSTGQTTAQATTEDLEPTLDKISQQRRDMVGRAKIYFELENTDVFEAMEAIPRHLFVPEDVRHLAYTDSALPIGYGQTISAPYMAAWMTEELELQVGDQVLEIGTGSGYQAAVLAQLGYVQVYSIEIIPELAESAASLLQQFDYENLKLTQGDGYFGWEEFAPYDAIIVTAAPDHLPAPLIQQLADGGRLLIPIGPTGGYQTMWKFIKQGDQVKAYNLGSVSFVPLVSAQEPQPMHIPQAEE